MSTLCNLEEFFSISAFVNYTVSLLQLHWWYINGKATMFFEYLSRCQLGLMWQYSQLHVFNFYWKLHSTHFKIIRKSKKYFDLNLMAKLLDYSGHFTTWVVMCSGLRDEKFSFHWGMLPQMWHLFCSGLSLLLVMADLTAVIKASLALNILHHSPALCVML